jgi:hypothetical protein
MARILHGSKFMADVLLSQNKLSCLLACFFLVEHYQVFLITNLYLVIDLQETSYFLLDLKSQMI